jgi:hypothetical protein
MKANRSLSVHQYHNDAINVQFLCHTDFLKRASQSAFRIHGNKVARQVVVGDELAVVRVGGAYACNLQQRITAENMIARAGRPRTKWPIWLAVKLSSAGGACAIADMLEAFVSEPLRQEREMGVLVRRCASTP